MDNLVMNTFHILEDVLTHNQFRILYIDEEVTVLCKMGCSQTNIFSASTEALSGMILQGDYLLYADTPIVIDVDALPASQKRTFETRKKIARTISERFSPTYLDLGSRQNSAIIKELCSEHNISRSSVWKIIRVYLQSGCNESSLIDMRIKNGGSRESYSSKSGNPAAGTTLIGIPLTNQVRNQFSEALAEYKSARAKTYEDAYNWLCSKYYSRVEYTPSGIMRVLLPESKRPTFKQFYHYCHTHLSKEQRDIIKTSAREYRNNKRLLLSDNLKDVMGPGDCIEMDEVEVDISLVSTVDPTKTVGRPIVYVMLDVYTRLIVAVSVSFDNNSVLAMTNCFLNLSDDKTEYCKAYGMTVPAAFWPSNFIPKRIRCDRGAEYKSKEALRIFNELGVSRELVPAATGSLKGSVEQIFHQMHSAQNPQLENIGLIEKRHDSQHHKEALLDINDFTKVLLNFVVTYNQTYLKNYPLTRDMISQGVKPIPLNLWDYGVKKYGRPRPIMNKDQYYYTLMTPVSARMSRKGIEVDGLYYMNYQDASLFRKMYSAQNKRVPIEVRMDVRDVGAVYYLSDGKLQKAPLNDARTGNAEFAGVTRADYLAYRKAKKLADREGAEHNRKLRYARTSLNTSVIEPLTEQRTSYASPANLKENRHTERQLVAGRNTIESRVEPAANPEKEAPKPTLPIVDWKEAMELFWEEN